MEITLLVVYFFLLTCVLLFSFFQLQLAVLYLRNQKKTRIAIAQPSMPEDIPYVTIQLPVYNELYVVERLIDAVSRINYPKNKFEIQMLDDSTDETSEIIRRKVNELKSKGLNIECIHRVDRAGFKAGALKNGLLSAKGEFIAIFDADFLPEPDFLLKTIPHFSDKNIGAVQTRWGHINKNYSILTRAQAFALDAHFTVEQSGRNRNGFFINFNGTAGVWRKTAILDAGNWEADTLTEDLDLSYRAQLKGWKFKYLEEVISPAELPVTLNAVKLQQFRWMKGGAQNCIKNYKKVLAAPISFKTKANAFHHMLSSTVFFFTFLIAILSFPMMLIRNYHEEYELIFTISSVFMITTLILLLFYAIPYFKENKSLASVLLYPVYFFLFLIFMFGLSLNNIVAISEAFLGKKSSFIRTPKFNIFSKNESWKANKYLTRKISFITILEGLLSLFFLGAMAFSVYIGQYWFLYFYAMLFLGFGAVSFLSIKQA
jgi:cellulose synthase/poly-beta-1,6-N-acetylglucosamine synthase-like glycosyltransferase